MLDDDLNACADLLRRGDPNRFRATMAAPVVARRVLFPIYAFNVEVARAPWVTQESMIAEMRLQWWRDALEEIGEGGTVRRHEVVTPLSQVLDAQGAKLLDELIVARRWDIYRDPFENMDHFDDYIQATAGNLLWVAARALSDAPESATREAGYALGVANWLQAAAKLERAGRVPMVEGTHEEIVTLATNALKRIENAAPEFKRASKAARPVYLALWQTRALLQLAAKEPERVGDGRLELSPLRSQLLLMRRALIGA